MVAYTIMTLREISLTDYQTIQTSLDAAGYSWISADQCLIPAQIRPDQADYSDLWRSLPKSEGHCGVFENSTSFESQEKLESIENSFLRELIESHLKILLLNNDAKSENLDVVVKTQRVVGTKDNPGEALFLHQGASYTAIHLIQRKNVKGGELKILSDEGEEIETKTPTRLMDGIFLSESGVILSESVISPINRLEPAIRDFLILEFYPRGESIRGISKVSRSQTYEGNSLNL